MAQSTKTMLFAATFAVLVACLVPTMSAQRQEKMQKLEGEAAASVWKRVLPNSNGGTRAAAPDFTYPAGDGAISVVAAPNGGIDKVVTFYSSRNHGEYAVTAKFFGSEIELPLGVYNSASISPYPQIIELQDRSLPTTWPADILYTVYNNDGGKVTQAAAFVSSNLPTFQNGPPFTIQGESFDGQLKIKITGEFSGIPSAVMLGRGYFPVLIAGGPPSSSRQTTVTVVFSAGSICALPLGSTSVTVCDGIGRCGTKSIEHEIFTSCSGDGGKG